MVMLLLAGARLILAGQFAGNIDIKRFQSETAAQLDHPDSNAKLPGGKSEVLRTSRLAHL